MPELPLFLKWFAGVLGVGSLFVWTMAGIRIRHRLPILEPTLTRAPDMHWLPLALTLAWVGLNLVMVFSTPVRAGDPPDRHDILEMFQLQLILLAGCGLPLLLQKTVPPREYGFHLQDPGGQASDGALGFLASVIPVVLAFFATLKWRTEENQHGLLRLLSEDRSIETLLLIVLLAAVLVPLVEELMYRVVLQTALEKLAHPREAMLVVAVIFSAMHQLPDAIPLFPLALILGYVYQQRRSYLTVVLIHVLFNGTNLLFMILTQELK
jgi:membrane protease YdiL (CAAX protease family)